MKNNKRIWIWAIIAVAIAIILIVIFSWHSGTKPTATTGVPSYAPQGQLVNGFPASLVLDASAQVSNSYSVNYSSSTNQYTAEWTSARSLNDLFSSYETYFKNNGWTISNEMTAYAGTKGLHAESANAAAGVSVIANGTSTKITVTYVAQQ